MTDASVTLPGNIEPPQSAETAPPTAQPGWRRLLKGSPGLWLAIAYLLFLVIVALFGSVLAPYDPISQNIPNRHAPSRWPIGWARMKSAVTWPAA